MQRLTLPEEIISRVMDGVASTFHACGVHGCDKKSLGLRCVSCRRFVCHRHGYLTLPSPSAPKPEPVCAHCVIDDNDNLLTTTEG